MLDRCSCIGKLGPFKGCKRERSMQLINKNLSGRFEPATPVQPIKPCYPLDQSFQVKRLAWKWPAIIILSFYYFTFGRLILYGLTVTYTLGQPVHIECRQGSAHWAARLQQRYLHNYYTLGLHRIVIWPDIRLNSNIEIFFRKKCTFFSFQQICLHISVIY